MLFKIQRFDLQATSIAKKYLAKIFLSRTKNGLITESQKECTKRQLNGGPTYEHSLNLRVTYRLQIAWYLGPLPTDGCMPSEGLYSMQASRPPSFSSWSTKASFSETLSGDFCCAQRFQVFFYFLQVCQETLMKNLANQNHLEKRHNMRERENQRVRVRA